MMLRFKCAECGKQLPSSLRGCWWRRYYGEVEILCPRCSLSAIDFRFGSDLISCDAILPPEVITCCS